MLQVVAPVRCAILRSFPTGNRPPTNPVELRFCVAIFDTFFVIIVGPTFCPPSTTYDRIALVGFVQALTSSYIRSTLQKAMTKSLCRTHAGLSSLPTDNSLPSQQASPVPHTGKTMCTPHAAEQSHHHAPSHVRLLIQCSAKLAPKIHIGIKSFMYSR